VEALDLAVRARPVWLGALVADVMPSSSRSRREWVYAQALSVITRLTVTPCSAKKASARSRKPTTVAARSSAWISQ